MHGTKGNGFQQAVAFCRIQKVDDEHLGTIGIPTISYHSCILMAVITYSKSSGS